MASTNVKDAAPTPGGGNPSGFQPFVSSSAYLPEFTPKAVLLGVLMGLIFGASTVYLGLRVGLTVSASIPIAVLSIAIFRGLARFTGGRATILENNIVQTTGSAGESIAAGVVFTIPALIFLGSSLEFTRTFLLALTGGWLGILFMIPLRRALIVKEHGNLTYPEGTACADILIAGEKGGSLAKMILWGGLLGAGYKTLLSIGGLWKERPVFNFPNWYKGASVTAEVSPELLGVGYIIGPKVASTMVAGGMLSALVLVPIIKFFGGQLSTVLYPAGQLIGEMGADAIRGTYVRYIGAGAVAAAGIINLVRAMPTIMEAFRSGMKDIAIANNKKGAGDSRPRTEQDLPMSLVIFGSLALVFILSIALWWLLRSTLPSYFIFLGAAILMIIFGFFFVTVSSRIVGEIGSSANPISGMTIATLMATSLIFVLLGWRDAVFGPIALTVGAVVCIAAANAGATSQDLKTGFLVGATPRFQQIGLIIGAMASVLIIGWTTILLNDAYTRVVEVEKGSVIATTPVHESMPDRQTGPDGQEYLVYRLPNESGGIPEGTYLVNPVDHLIRFEERSGIGSATLPAPQALLMSVVIKGLLTQKLPWTLVLIGAAISIIIHLSGGRALVFAVGVYLPLSTTAAIFVGGMVRGLIDRAMAKSGGAEESETSGGTLFSSGLIAGGSLTGILTAALTGWAIGPMQDAAGRTLLSPEGDHALSAIHRIWSVTKQFAEENAQILESPRWMHSMGLTGGMEDLVSIVLFGLLTYSLYRFGRKKVE
ncbi:MAG: oligopeptide transporter, OPT family [Acidobacteria bacterium]|nr:oligopeptide transporter, OPT family [Acidobacteriota bacterium]